METKCFFLTPTHRAILELRRYSSTKCPTPHGYHNATTNLGEVSTDYSGEAPPREYPKWPRACECGYVFLDTDQWQQNKHTLYERSDGGAPTTLGEAPPGAMWYADWLLIRDPAPGLENYNRGPDGHCLMVRCPDGHDWCVDGQCNNCTMPTDYVHKCWVRHGTPPDITVDKNGNTCAAGAGSIQTRSWHGFLRNGVLA